jgi:hypothetical protein
MFCSFEGCDGFVLVIQQALHTTERPDAPLYPLLYRRTARLVVAKVVLRPYLREVIA